VQSLEESPSVEELLGDDHKQLDELLKALLAARDQPDPRTLFERLDLFWARLAMHIRAENLHLFPAILNGLQANSAQRNENLLAAETREAIAQLSADHNFFMHELAASVKAVRTIIEASHSEAQTQTIDSVRRSITAVSKRLESHNEVEETLVYRLPKKLLTPDKQLIVVERMRRELQNLPPRFSEVKQERPR
jgi:hemerythrin-like domain-containing protein